MPTFTTDDGASLYYESRGAGPEDAIYLHWMGGDTKTWHALWDALGPPGFRHIALDARGHGQSTSTPCAFSAERLARDVLQLADALGIHRFVVVGHSFGGKIALQLATMAGDRVRGLVLIGAAGPGEVGVPRAAAEEILPRAHERAFVGEVFRPWFNAWGTATIERALDQWSRTRNWALRATCEMTLWTDLSATVRPFLRPALVFAGADDPVYGPAYQARAVSPFVPHGTFIPIANCGHGLVLERPAEIAAHIAAFLHDLPTK